MAGILQDLHIDSCQDLAYDLPWFIAGILQDLHIDSCQDLAYDLPWFMTGIPQVPVKICTYDPAILGWNLTRSTHRFLSRSWSTLVDKLL